MSTDLNAPMSNVEVFNYVNILCKWESDLWLLQTHMDEIAWRKAERGCRK